MSTDSIDAVKQIIERTALKYAVENRMKYGEAKQGPVLNKVLGEYRQFKSMARDIAKIVEETIKYVNSLSASELQDLAEKFGLLERKETKKEGRGLPPLPNVEQWGGRNNEICS